MCFDSWVSQQGKRAARVACFLFLACFLGQGSGLGRAMRITGVEAWLVKMRLGRPYTSAYDTLDTTANVFVRVLTDRRYVGCGCAAPD